MSAALNLIVPAPMWLIVLAISITTATLQIWGSFTLLFKNVFRWLALLLLAYVGSAFLAKPDWMTVLNGTFIPHIRFETRSLSMLVVIVGSTLSAYLYSWQSNQEVEEDITLGRRRLVDRMGTNHEELTHSAKDVAAGITFANVITYFILLSTAATLFEAGKTDMSTAAQAAQALEPIAGKLAGVLFTVGVVSVGFIAVPIMTTGPAYDLCQALGWKQGLNYPPSEVKRFNAVIALCTALAMGLNFGGVNPMKALVWSSVVQGISTPFLMLMVMFITNNRKIMGRWVNTRPLNVLGLVTTVATFAATIGLFASWLM